MSMHPSPDKPILRRGPLLRRSGLALSALVLVCSAWIVSAAAPLPPAPQRYVLDEPGVIPAAEEEALVQKLEKFERETSDQIVVAIFRKLPAGQEVADYSLRVARSWKVGGPKNNGIVLFVYYDDHKMNIQVGYGLEGAVPDAIAKRIIDNDITPSFKAGKFGEGIGRGVTGLMQAAQGEYKGTGSTVREREFPKKVIAPLSVIGLIGFIILVSVIRFAQRGMVYRGRSRGWAPSPWWFSGGSGWGGGSSGGSSSWSSGGGFSGGGGSFGGGGASGSW